MKQRPLRATFSLVCAVIVLAGCGTDSETERSPTPSPGGGSEGLSAHLQDIYDQQKSVCKAEAKFNSPEYREQNGAMDPQGYAEYAAEHGFYAVRDAAERNAAIEGCLAGLP